MWFYLERWFTLTYTQDSVFSYTESVDMTDDKQLDYLISVLYETALDPNRWQEAVKLCGYYMGGVEGQLSTIDKKRNILITYLISDTTFSLQGTADFANYYFPLDPRLSGLFGGAVGEWRCCHHYHDQNFVDRSEFYQDFLIPNSVRYGMCAIVVDNDDYFTTFGSIRAVDQTPFDTANIVAAQRIGSHMQRTLYLQKHTQNLQTKAALGARAIDALALSMLIVDGKGIILHLNTGAECLLNSRNSGISCKNNRLLAADYACRDRLTALIAEATGYPAVGGAIFLSGEQTRQLFVTPLPAASPFAQDWQRPLALVLVMETGKSLLALQLQAALYDLSPAELRVASALLTGKSPEEYALEAGVTMNTVRTQLKNLFSKTGTHRQSELVAVLSSVPPLQIDR